MLICILCCQNLGKRLGKGLIITRKDKSDKTFEGCRCRLTLQRCPKSKIVSSSFRRTCWDCFPRREITPLCESMMAVPKQTKFPGTSVKPRRTRPTQTRMYKHEDRQRVESGRYWELWVSSQGGRLRKHLLDTDVAVHKPNAEQLVWTAERSGQPSVLLVHGLTGRQLTLMRKGAAAQET